MSIRTLPKEIWQEYEVLAAHNRREGLYETVRRNENFYIGRQWEGVRAPDLDKPVINVLKRVIGYFIATIVSDDVACDISPFMPDGSQGEALLCETIAASVDEAMEQSKLKAFCRDIVRNAAVDGDGYLYIHFDPEAPTGQVMRGGIRGELMDSTDVYFGNPRVNDVQRQPYLLLSSRRLLEEARRECEEWAGAEEAAKLLPDEEEDPVGEKEAESDGSVTVLLKLWKREGRVFAEKVTRDCVLRPVFDTGLTLYPLAGMCWEKVKNSCHGQAAVSGLIPNQIFINKLFAMCMEHVKKMAFPKVIYNADMLPDGWDNRVGEAIPIHGDPGSAIAGSVGGADMSQQVVALIEKVIQYTRDTMGATDVALGNVRPDNTSAIIAVQKVSSMPLELQRLAFYQFVEDAVRILLDQMAAYYGKREVCLRDKETGTASRVLFDFSRLRDAAMKLKVDIGAGSYWSELMQIQTLDNLFQAGVITDAGAYLEALPADCVRNKAQLIAAIREKKGEEA